MSCLYTVVRYEIRLEHAAYSGWKDNYVINYTQLFQQLFINKNGHIILSFLQTAFKRTPQNRGTNAGWCSYSQVSFLSPPTGHQPLHGDVCYYSAALVTPTCSPPPFPELITSRDS